MIPKRIYNPAQLSPDELKASFVARHETLAHLMDILAEQKPGHPCQHVILVGPRGMGKTTLGLRFLQEISDRPDLASKWQPVPFPEESYDITDLANFWIAALRHLSCATNDSRWNTEAQALRQDETDNQRQAEYALAALLDCCQDIGKRLILFVENLDLVFEQLRDEREVHALRAALMAHPAIMVVGSANAVFDAIRSHGQPFYEFFRLIRLQGLSQEECSQLLEALVEAEGTANLAGNMDQERGRLETIRHLTGGNPRLLVLACRMLIESPLGSAFEDLERLIDEQTPYFKANIEALPVQARGVFHCLAEAWAPMLTQEVSAAAKLSSSHASAQLRQLKEKGYVHEIHLRDEKRARYEVADRFYNIYHVLRFSRSGRERLARLVGFLHELFGPTAMRSLYPVTLEALRTKDMPTGETADWIVVLAGYVGRDAEYSERREWRTKAVNLIFEKGIELDALDQVEEAFDAGHPVSEDLVATRKALKLALRAVRGHEESTFEKFVENPQDSLIGWILKGLTAEDPEALNRTIKAFGRWKATANQAKNPETRALLWGVSYAECQALLKLGRSQEAADVICGSLDLVDREQQPELLLGQATMLLDCGNKLAEAGIRDQASPLFARVAELAQPAHPWKLRAMSAQALLFLIGQHLQAGNTEEWLAVSQEVLRLARTDDPPEIKTMAIVALGGVASWFAIANRVDEAMAALKRLLGYVKPVIQSNQRQKCAELLALTALGLSARALIEPKLAESICKTATEIDPTCATAWQGLATLVLAGGSKNRQAEAESHARRAVQRAPDDCGALLTLSNTLSLRGKWTEAIDVLERALSAKEGVPDQVLGSLATYLMILLAAGHTAKVKQLMANANLSERLETLWHATRAELGESIEPLPAEVFEAVKEVRRQIAEARAGRPHPEGVVP